MGQGGGVPLHRRVSSAELLYMAIWLLRMAYNTLERVWDVGVSKALGWNFICWFPSLYILDYLVPHIKKNPVYALTDNVVNVVKYRATKLITMI